MTKVLSALSKASSPYSLKRNIVLLSHMSKFLLTQQLKSKFILDLKTPKFTYEPQSAAFSIEKQMEIPLSLSGYIWSFATWTD